MQRRDELERALKKPGPGTLIQPWYGEIFVSQFAPYKVRHTAADGGMAVFTLSFVRDSRPGAPAAKANAREAAKASALDFGKRAAEFYDKAQEARRKIIGDAELETMQRVAGEVRGAMASSGTPPLSWKEVLFSAAGAAGMGGMLWSVMSGTGAGTAAKKAQGLLAAAQKMTPAASEETAPPGPAPVSPETLGTTRAAIQASDLAVRELARNIALAEASLALADAVPDSRSEAAELREGFVDALDAALPAMPDAIFVACTEMRANTLAALAVAAKSAPQVIRRAPACILPSLALAYSFSGPGFDEGDLVRRNRIIHPGFVPVMPLEVLV
jgi:prophage DNA circulation protein